jgi:hypothetical protein
MEFVKGCVVQEKQNYKIKLKNGKLRECTVERYNIIVDEEKIFKNQEKVIIIKESDWNNLSNTINDFKALEIMYNSLKFINDDLKDEIKTLKEYNRYLELENKVEPQEFKNNFYTQ